MLSRGEVRALLCFLLDASFKAWGLHFAPCLGPVICMFFLQLVEGQARLEAFLNEGPHLLISNLGMRSCWRIYCRTCGLVYPPPSPLSLYLSLSPAPSI